MDQGTFSLARVFLWIGVAVLAYFMGWLASVVFVSFLSIWALVETAWAAYRADRNKKLLEEIRRIVREEIDR